MTLASHLIELKKKHVALSERIKKMQNSPGSNYLEITELKKEKLRLKEEIMRLQNPKRLTRVKVPKVPLEDLEDNPDPIEGMSEEALQENIVQTIIEAVEKAA